VFSLDPERFQLERVQEYVDYLHAHDQKYVVMVDPAVAYAEYPPFERGAEDDVFMLRADGSIWQGVVWPGVVAFPDWFAPNIGKYWNTEFEKFFSPQGGVDIDALWIDMNEPSNFPCNFPCDPKSREKSSNPFGAAEDYPPKPPPVRDPPRPLPGFSCAFQPPGTKGCFNYTHPARKRGEQRAMLSDDADLLPRREASDKKGLPGRDLLFPKYAIHNAQAYKPSWNADRGGISNKTLNTDLIHRNGLAEYDTHNLYGTMMSSASRDALLHRRPGLRPMIITRSTFPGAGRQVGKWLGDNVSSWDKYRASIRTMLAFSAVYQMPVVGSDVCGFVGNTTEQLCARWASLGAFAPFYRNHNDFAGVPQEFYRWASVAESARKAIGVRYRLLDYIYTALRRAAADGTPIASPLFFAYPDDAETFALELQYLYGPALMVAPVTQENATSVRVYFPDDVFYDWYSHEVVDARGAAKTVDGQGWTDIPLYVRGGSVLPVRAAGGMTTAEVRTRDFEILVAPGADGTARGELYVDDGVSLEQEGVTLLEFTYAGGVLTAEGRCDFAVGVKIGKVTVMGAKGDVTKEVDLALDGECGFTVQVE
jgi:alpha-glucosidase